MSDAEIRALERLAATGGTVARERLEDAWLRAGRGWNGDRLVANERGNMAAEGTRGVYRWLVAPLAALEIPLVYVPGGEVPCERCSGRGDWPFTVTSPEGTGTLESGGCPDCQPSGIARPSAAGLARGTGRVKIAPHYIGRFPVTWREYLTFKVAQRPGAKTTSWLKLHGSDSAPGMDGYELNRPVVNVTVEDARAFCAWAGLRLPTASEWRWAALGAPVRCSNCNDGGERGQGCRECGRTGMRLRQFPWSLAADVIRENGPTPERCAAADPRHNSSVRFPGSTVRLRASGSLRPGDLVAVQPDGTIGPATAGDEHGTVIRYEGESAEIMTFRHSSGGTAPVLEWLCPSASGGFIKPKPGLCVAESLEFPAHEHTSRCRLAPARPAGKSWCGAHDMVGNVHQIVADGTAWGGSFRTDMDVLRMTGPVSDARDDVGFRVALDVAS